MDRTCRAALLALALASAACAPSPGDADHAGAPVAHGGDTAQLAARGDAADARSPLVALDPDATVGARADVAGGGRWFLQESDPPTAAWGVPGSEGMLTIGCDRAGGQLLLERQAVGVPDDVRVVVLDADGVRMDYPAERRETTLAPMLVTRVALDAPILDRLLGAQRMRVVAGDDVIATRAPGHALRAVVEACRRGLPG